MPGELRNEGTREDKARIKYSPEASKAVEYLKWKASPRPRRVSPHAQETSDIVGLPSALRGLQSRTTVQQSEGLL